VFFIFFRLNIIEDVTSKKRGSWHVLKAEQPIQLMTSTSANIVVKVSIFIKVE